MKNSGLKLLFQFFLWYLFITIIFFSTPFFISLIPIKYKKLSFVYTVYGSIIIIPGMILYFIGTFLFRKFILFLVKFRFVRPKSARLFLDVFYTIYAIFWLTHFFLVLTGVIEL